MRRNEEICDTQLQCAANQSACATHCAGADPDCPSAQSRPAAHRAGVFARTTSRRNGEEAGMIQQPAFSELEKLAANCAAAANYYSDKPGKVGADAVIDI